jgi:hypothetical protein
MMKNAAAALCMPCVCAPLLHSCISINWPLCIHIPVPHNQYQSGTWSIFRDDLVCSIDRVHYIRILGFRNAIFFPILIFAMNEKGYMLVITESCCGADMSCSFLYSVANLLTPLCFFVGSSSKTQFRWGHCVSNSIYSPKLPRGTLLLGCPESILMRCLHVHRAWIIVECTISRDSANYKPW